MSDRKYITDRILSFTVHYQWS